MDKTLTVLVNDEVLGTLTQSANGRLSFVYENDWRNLVDAYPLSLSMPLTERDHSGRGLTNYLWGLLPDDDRALRELGQEHSVSHRSAFALIQATGEDLPGSVQIVPPEDVDDLEGRKGLRQIPEDKLAEFLDNLVRHPGMNQINPDDDEGRFSLAGMQPKKALCYVNGKWYEQRGRTPTTHIIKPPIADLEGRVENEHFCLRLADKIGLPVVTSQVMKIGGKPNIVVERYDRQRRKGQRRLPLDKSGGTVLRIHQEDVCQALGIHPDRKYQREGGPGLKAVMNLLESSGDPKTDRERFMRAIVFNFIIAGVDAHGKNYSLLIAGGGRFRLAPIYDVISALPYDQNVYHSLAMSVGTVRKWEHIDPYHWQKEAQRCNYSADALLDEIAQQVKDVPRAAKTLLHDLKKEGLEHDMLDELVDEIYRRCNKLAKAYA